MANQSVLELAVGTGRWDAGLKKAKSALDNFTQANGGLQQALDKESQKMQQFVRMMGSMESTAKTAKGQMNDYKGTIEQLTMQYNRMSEAQKKTIGQDYLQAIDQMKQKYQAVNNEIQEMNRSLNNVKLPDIKDGGGGLFAGLGDKMSGAMQVFAGNMLTKAAGAVANLGSEMVDMVQQGVELAKQGEGIRIAFERLGRGDILDGLREATHGTVTDIELMKAAVKFNDFKLPLDELGTMLAFAQQKAKDTGQSVDYMVDSIVTGLGRKSLMILDNLGLSANEIKDKMAETGDMTKAVGAIIREQMSKAGDYVETAADRATQADVKLKNAMEDLGRTFEPLTSASGSLWNSIKVGALNALNTAVKPLIQALAEAGMLGQGARSSAGFNNLGGNSKVDRMIGRLGNGKTAGSYSIYQKQLGEFDKFINNKRFQIAAYGNDNSSVAQSAKARLQTELDGALKMRAEYVKRAQELHNQVPSPFEPASTSAGGGRSGGGNTKTEPTYAPDSIAAQQALVQQLTKQWNEAGAEVRSQYVQPLVEAEAKLKEMQNTMALKKAQAEGKLNGVNLWQGDIDDISGGKTPQFAGSLPDLSKSLQLDNLPLAPLQQLNAELQHLRDILETAPNTEAYQTVLQAIIDKKKQIEQFTTVNIDEGMKDSAKSAQAAASAFNQVGSALSSIEDPSAKVMAIVAQAIATIAQAYASALAADKTTKSNIWAFIGAAAASIASMTTTISQVHAATGYERGGEIKGNTYSGDQIPIMANAGEIILNRAQAGNLASQLQGSNINNLNLTATIKGEDIRLAINNNGRRTGRGEYVTTRFR